MPNNQDILPPAITDRSVADSLIQKAIRHFHEARRATIQVMADLRLLQDGDVHTLYGYKNFAKWAEDTFDGLAAGNVRQLTRAGAVALELDRRNLIDLENLREGVGTTGLRALSVVSGVHGDDKMAEVFITARGMIEPGEWVSGVNVDAAMRLLMPPVNSAAVAVIEEGEREAQEEEEEEEGSEHSAKVMELIEHVRDLSYDLPESLADLKMATEQLENQLVGENSDKDQQWINGPLKGV